MLDTATNLSDRLKDPTLLATCAYVDGAWMEGDKGTFAVVNPARGDVVAQVADLSRDQVALAIDVAERAQTSWAAQTGKERASILRAWFALIMENQEDLAMILTAEMGKPLAEARGEIAYAASFVEFFAEEAKRIYGETIPANAPDQRILVWKQPVGVVCSITPWNFPSAMITRKAAPALAAGCSFVARPADLTPLSATALAVLAERAGIPAGVFQVVTTLDAADTGQEFCDNQKVRKITFTGSTAVGRLLLGQAANTVKRASMELGGNAPLIIFDDADIDAAIPAAIACKFRNNGQTCVCANRIYVQDGVHDEFVEKFSAAVARLQVGDGMEGADLGPLISPAAVEKVKDHIRDAVELGAEVAMGGLPHDLGPLFFEPTILTGVTQQMKVSHEETFGPMAPIFRFGDVEEVIEMANDTIFGLAAYFFARDLSRVYRVAEALEYGIVGVNTGIISSEVAPFGGVKQSGLGREGSHHGIDEYLELKYICMSV